MNKLQFSYWEHGKLGTIIHPNDQGKGFGQHEGDKVKAFYNIKGKLKPRYNK